MNKQQLMEILESCLLYYEGMKVEEIKKLIDSENVDIGRKMCAFLMERIDSKEEKHQENKDG